MTMLQLYLVVALAPLEAGDASHHERLLARSPRVSQPRAAGRVELDSVDVDEVRYDIHLPRRNARIQDRSPGPLRHGHDPVRAPCRE